VVYIVCRFPVEGEKRFGMVPLRKERSFPFFQRVGGKEDSGRFNAPVLYKGRNQRVMDCLEVTG